MERLLQQAAAAVQAAAAQQPQGGRDQQAVQHAAQVCHTVPVQHGTCMTAQ